MITPKRFDLRELYCKVLIRNVRIAEDERKFKTQPALKKKVSEWYFLATSRRYLGFQETQCRANISPQ